MAKRTWFSAKARPDGIAEVAIYDEIGGHGVNAHAFRNELSALGDVKSIDLRLNSPGGDVFDGIAIHNMLARHPAPVTVTVDGIAASIASLIAMAGDRIVMPENSMMMIHNPFGMVIGTASDMEGMSSALNKIRDGMVATYARRSGAEPDAIVAMMDAETWLTAPEALDKGFADEVSGPVRVTAKFDLSKYEPPEAIKAAYDPDGDGDDDALEALGYIGQAMDALADAIGCLTGTGEEDDAGMGSPMMRAKERLAVLREQIQGAANAWSVGAARDLAIDSSSSWDGPAAAARMLDKAGFNGDSPDSSMARRGFLVFDSGNPNLKGSYKLPFADYTGGSLKAVVGGLRAAASRLPQTDIPDDVRSRARAVLDGYFKKRDGGASDAIDDAADRVKEQIDITAACQLAGVPGKAVEFLRSGKSLSEVQSALLEMRVDQSRPGSDGEINARRNVIEGDPTLSWAKAIQRVSSRNQ